LNERKKLSVVMIARNAAERLPDVLKSVEWADEICVADTGSSDSTLEIAKKHGAVTKHIDFKGFGEAKQEAAQMATHKWVFSLDSDEVVTEKLRDAILSFLENCDSDAGAEFARVTNFCGKWIYHSGWYPEYILRIFSRDRARFNDKVIHESIEYEGKLKRIDGDLLHYSYPTLNIYLKKLEEYARLGAQSKRSRPKVLNLLSMFIKPVVVYIKKLIIQLGFLDGKAGLKIARMSAYGQYLKYKYALTREKTD